MGFTLEECFHERATVVRHTYSAYLVAVRRIQGGSNMTETDFCVNKPHCAAAVRP